MHFSLSLRAARRLSLAALYMLTVLAMLLSAVGCSKVENPIHENNTSDATEPVETESSNVPQDNTPGFYNILNGESCSQEQAQIRPLAIMVNNIKASLPQVGLEKADIIYECEAEGTITRLLALFSHYADITEPIGSIRSSREYFIDFAANHDAIYIHTVNLLLEISTTSTGLPAMHFTETRIAVQWVWLLNIHSFPRVTVSQEPFRIKVSARSSIQCIQHLFSFPIQKRLFPQKVLHRRFPQSIPLSNTLRSSMTKQAKSICERNLVIHTSMRTPATSFPLTM